MIRINDKGLCEKCGKLVIPYYITRKKCLCFKHLEEKEKEKVLKFDKLKELKRKRKEELKNLKRILDYVKRAYLKGYEEGLRKQL
jgi:hypothetical protein